MDLGTKSEAKMQFGVFCLMQLRVCMVRREGKLSRSMGIVSKTSGDYALLYHKLMVVFGCCHEGLMIPGWVLYTKTIMAKGLVMVIKYLGK